ncbi:MAG: Cof-type HAD-IIB family hydrolase [Culicoidibacterales bacterium]
MIKLIATDMDGTLLNSAGELPQDFDTVFRQMQQAGVLFAAASGRQYYNLLATFEGYHEDMLFLAENGTLVMYKGEELYVHDLPLSIAHDLLKIGRTVPHTALILCGKNAAYIENTDPEFIAQVEKYYERYEIVEDLLLVQDTILKVTLFDFTCAQTNSLPHFSSYVDILQVSVSGQSWLDVTNKGANKGKALQAIQTRFGMSEMETMVFGDYLNDLELMQSAHHSYAMKNAHPKLKEVARFESELTNEEAAVTTIIKDVLTTQ